MEVNIKQFLMEFEKFVKEYEEQQHKQQVERNKVIKHNRKYMIERSKELGREIPDEIYAWIYSCEPRGLSFFERNKEWFHDMFEDKKEQDNIEKVFQYQMRRFGVRFESVKTGIKIWK